MKYVRATADKSFLFAIRNLDWKLMIVIKVLPSAWQAKISSS